MSTEQQQSDTDIPPNGAITLGPSMWPTKSKPRRVRFLRWAWQVTDEDSGEVLEKGHATSETGAWTRLDRVAKRIHDERVAKRKQAES